MLIADQIKSKIFNRAIIALSIVLALILTHTRSQATDYIKLSNLAMQRYGEHAKNNILELQALMIELRDLPETEKVKRINEFFNIKIKNFDEDINTWGQVDYWATPLESIGRERGDCEDYSIAKYIFLKELGITNDKLKITYVKAQLGGPYSKTFQAHMVLGYYPELNAEPLILDNLISDIRPASRRRDLTPIYSFNSEGLWVGSSAKGDSTSHLSRWRDLLLRIKSDGIDITQ